MTNETEKTQQGKLENILSVVTGLAIGAGSVAVGLSEPSTVNYMLFAGTTGVGMAAVVSLGKGNVAGYYVGGATCGVLGATACASFGPEIAASLGGTAGAVGTLFGGCLKQPLKFARRAATIAAISGALVYGNHKMQRNYQSESVVQAPTELQVPSNARNIETTTQ